MTCPTYLVTQRGNPGGAPLMKLIPASPTVETLKQQLPARLTEHEREESLPNEIVRVTRRNRKLVQYLHRDLLALQSTYVHVPVERYVRIADVRAAHLAVQVAQLHRLGEGVAKGQVLADLDARPLLVGQVGAQELGMRKGVAVRRRSVRLVLRVAVVARLRARPVEK